MADKVSLLRATVPEPRQGRKIVAQGASPGGGRAHLPTADAVGYLLSPRCIGADFINELLTQDTRANSAATKVGFNACRFQQARFAGTYVEVAIARSGRYCTDCGGEPFVPQGGIRAVPRVSLGTASISRAVSESRTAVPRPGRLRGGNS